MKSESAVATGRRKKAAGRSDTLGTNSEIGRKLKQYYDELISEDVPDRFADLLRQLEDREDRPALRDGEG